MRAIIKATGFSEEIVPLVNYRPTPLLNISDKPILFYIIEFLARHGIKQCDIFLCHLPKMIEDVVGSGERWGLKIDYYLVRSKDHLFNLLTPLSRGWKDDKILVGRGDMLPHFAGNLDLETLALYFMEDKTWSGWGVIPCQSLANIPRETSYNELPSYIKVPYKHFDAHPFLSTRSFKELLDSNIKMIGQKPEEHLFPTSAHKVEPGVWISRSVSIHPTANIKPPVFIGEYTQIKENTEIGPHTVIEKHCIIDKGSSVKSSLVCKRSYIGEGIQLDNCIVYRNLLINMDIGTQFEVNDEFIISGIAPFTFHQTLIYVFARLASLFLLIMLSPFLLLLWAFCRFKDKKVLQLPSSLLPYRWKTFNWYVLERRDGKQLNPFLYYLRSLPNLWNIFRGYAHFVGLMPRTPEQVSELPPDWRKLYLQSKVGIFTLPDVEHGKNPTADELYATETYYASSMNPYHDLKIMLKSLFTNTFKG